MYKLHLILKYLRKRRIAWVSLLAVMLNTTMVLVVISVMGGWLRMFRESFHGLSGDVIVSARSPAGFPFYREIQDALVALPEVRASVPVIKTFGLLSLPKTSRGDVEGVQVLGFPIDQIGKVTRFDESLYRQHQLRLDAAELARDPSISSEQREYYRRIARQPATAPSFALLPDVDYRQAYQAVFPKAGEKVLSSVGNHPGMIVGAGVVGIRKDQSGNITGRSSLMYRSPAKLMVMGIPPGDAPVDLANKVERYYWIVDDSRTKVWQYDSNTVYVPFEVLQRDLGMEEHEAEDPKGQKYMSPARTTELHVAVREGVNLLEARRKVRRAVYEVFTARGIPMAEQDDPWGDPVRIQTWEQAHAKWLGAIEKEKVLVTFLYGIMCIVSIFLIFCIFYMIVVEKTRDIGIVKSVGATSGGVAGIFLGYGAAIGLVGSAAGLLAAWQIVRHINTLHQWMGRAMGVQIWDPEVYVFDTIPNTMNPTEATVIVIVAIVASVIGALLPAIRAALLKPVEALRWE